MTDSQTLPIRVLIADDHPIVRQGLHSLIDLQPDMETVGEATDGAEAVSQAKDLQPDVILLDLMMPRMGGIEAIGKLKRDNPNVRILVLTSFAEDEKILTAIKRGAMGYHLKDSAPRELIQAIRHLYDGEPSLHPQVAFKLMQGLDQGSEPKQAKEILTEREMEVLQWVARGSSNQDIASKLAISERTIGTHVGNILSKLGLSNRTQVALYALREGIVTLDEIPADF